MAFFKHDIVSVAPSPRAGLRRKISYEDRVKWQASPASKGMTSGGETTTLPRSEFQILHYLMRHPDQVATRRRLEEQLYGWDHGAESNALEVHIHHLRRRVGKETIRTLRGVGYLLDSLAAARVTECP